MFLTGAYLIALLSAPATSSQTSPAIPVFQVAAFASEAHSGNPAGVALLASWLSDAAMLALAAQLNPLSETAFIVPSAGDRFAMRWFSAKAEVPMCGHATLAAAAVLFSRLGDNVRTLTFDTQSGPLTATRDGTHIVLDFPSAPSTPIAAPRELLGAMGIDAPLETLYSAERKKLLVILSSADAVRNVHPDFAKMMTAHTTSDIKGVIISAPGAAPYDMVSRYFAPWVGVDEDPVTGSAHTVLGPYWAKRLHKNELRAYQASRRTGEMVLRLQPTGRIRLVGDAVVVWSDTVLADDVSTSSTSTPDFAGAARAARWLLSQLVAVDTTNPPGNEARAVTLLAARLQALGIAYEVSELAPGRQNLVARLPGNGAKKPLLVLSHLDVVGASTDGWSSSNPHRLEDHDGYLVGRGVLDDLGMGAVSLEALALMKRSGVPLTRDLIVAWTAGEESQTGLDKGINVLLRDHRASIDAGLAFNEGGGAVLGDDGDVQYVEIAAAEKTHQNFEVAAHGPTGHSAVPLPGNPIQRLARALDRLEHFQFPAHLTPLTRAYFAARARFEPADVASAMQLLSRAKGALPSGALHIIDAHPALAVNLRTTCVTTLISGGSRLNALPQEAKANINCRIAPDETIEGTQQRLAALFADPELAITATTHYGFSEPSDVAGEGPSAIAKVAHALWPRAPVMHVLGGSTDSKYLRQAGIPTYGLNPLPVSETDGNRAHGTDERLPVTSLEVGVEFLYRLMSELATDV